MQRIGLTGGIGSGKSTVALMLRELGVAVVDADEQSRRVTGPGGAAIEPIRSAFGPAFVDSSGALDRAAMRSLVFQDPGAKQRLEAIIHPLVGAAMALEAAAAQAAGAKAVVFDIPLLVESAHWRTRLDAVWVVDCSPAVQVERVLARAAAAVAAGNASAALTPAAVEAIIAQQAPRPRRLAAADAVICNEGLSLHALRDNVRALAAQLMRA